MVSSRIYASLKEVARELAERSWHRYQDGDLLVSFALSGNRWVKGWQSTPAEAWHSVVLSDETIHEVGMINLMLRQISADKSDGFFLKLNPDFYVKISIEQN